jgi:hypothetical protein
MYKIKTILIKVETHLSRVIFFKVAYLIKIINPITIKIILIAFLLEGYMIVKIPNNNHNNPIKIIIIKIIIILVFQDYLKIDWQIIR